MRNWAWITIVLLLLGGCAGGPPREATAPRCAYADAPRTSAPAWVCGAPLAGLAVSAVGSAQPSAAGYDAMRTEAVSVGRDWLVDHLRAYAGRRLDGYAAAHGPLGTDRLRDMKASVEGYITKTTVLGSRVYRTATSPSGTLYVLVGLSDSLARRQLRDALRASMQNEPALWRGLLAGRDQAGLAAEIADRASEP